MIYQELQEGYRRHSKEMKHHSLQSSYAFTATENEVDGLRTTWHVTSEDLQEAPREAISAQLEWKIKSLHDIFYRFQEKSRYIDTWNNQKQLIQNLILYNETSIKLFDALSGETGEFIDFLLRFTIALSQTINDRLWEHNPLPSMIEIGFEHHFGGLLQTSAQLNLAYDTLMIMNREEFRRFVKHGMGESFNGATLVWEKCLFGPLAPFETRALNRKGLMIEKQKKLTLDELIAGKVKTSQEDNIQLDDDGEIATQPRRMKNQKRL
ncbi:hypothetical protein C5B42_03280 [Candidatus Cerribacteria bacterium 'Amazon FNV 2010 28 9']|uniref:Uncharacterized protein n=1 Tax=Candidatus Cerribacteria bacterium 'Amazon FNV 2010 28 9' TaxID=2081795 RepID=A0A317JP13_9BACT|nr:MAG: hypothetical protein C5B42_03280 [Candidatus Cerribacteria bacterium 'Amazon FNV 2010 28 9']